jgi:phosphoketolase
LKEQRIESVRYAYAEGLDKPEIQNWKWPLG